MSTDLSPPAARTVARYHWWGGLVGAFCLGLLGGAHGAALYVYPEYREAAIEGQLSHPHPDSERFLASIYSIRYQSLPGLVLRMAAVPLICGAFAGVVIGTIINHVKLGKLPAAWRESRPRAPALIGLLLAVFVLLLALFQPNHGLVYYDGKDQFYWLHLLRRGEAADKRQSLKALCALLKGDPFPCRSTIVPAIAACGQDAEAAIPVLQRLATDHEEAVREAADKALHKLRSGAL